MNILRRKMKEKDLGEKQEKISLFVKSQYLGL
jgi:hypothetical protein